MKLANLGLLKKIVRKKAFFSNAYSNTLIIMYFNMLRELYFICFDRKQKNNWKTKTYYLFRINLKTKLLIQFIELIL